MKWLLILFCLVPLFLLPPIAGPDLSPLVTVAWILAVASVTTAAVGGAAIVTRARLQSRKPGKEGK